MDSLPHSMLLEILSHLDDSADVARCRVASKAFNTVFPCLRFISLQYSVEWYNSLNSFKTVFLDLVSKQEAVESVRIRSGLKSSDDIESEDFNLTDENFSKEWLPKVSDSLKWLSITNGYEIQPSNILPLISTYCHKLVNLELKNVWLYMDNLNPIPMLTSLTLTCTTLEDEELNELNKCLPNLQVLNLKGVIGLKAPKIHHLNLKFCLIAVCDHDEPTSLSLITPNLITLKIEYFDPYEAFMLSDFHLNRRFELVVEAPMLSDFHLNHRFAASTLTLKKFENLTTLCLDSLHLGSILSEFPITKTVKDLTLSLPNKATRYAVDSKLTFRKVFTVFPNVSSLCIYQEAWSELIEACLNPEDWEILNGRKGLKTICAFVRLADPDFTFSSVARVLDQCVGLSKVWLLFNGDGGEPVWAVCDSFTSKCIVRWPGLNWTWGLWGKEMEKSWMTNVLSNSTPQII